ncbi:hypothetical protein cyc_08128 [Cyclospora cayetanensis]|uniref:Uncharacterized protein n=1 Tax=Cyclospora cayetanensis TaxID=88456 RepID=A0A1D3CU03_9EIME|nr:hypothetical protein cyc_08128 [Cyclospora cayetanensis]
MLDDTKRLQTTQRFTNWGDTAAALPQVGDPLIPSMHILPQRELLPNLDRGRSARAGEDGCNNAAPEDTSVKTARCGTVLSGGQGTYASSVEAGTTMPLTAQHDE